MTVEDGHPASAADTGGAREWYRCATEPKSIAVVGASEAPGKSNYMVNLMRNNFPGTIYPVNPNRETIFGLPAYPDLRSLPDVAEAVWLLVPAA
ncbi:MAG: CoA-binding protein, partial [Sciscionella sp.]